jgi:two-component system CheB/CheR fusion protein
MNQRVSRGSGARSSGAEERIRELEAAVAELEATCERIRHEERCRGQAASQESETRFQALVKASSDVVYRMNPDWSEMYHLVGRDFIADTSEPSRTWLQKYIHPDDQKDVLSVINEAIRTRSVFDLVHQVLRVDGSRGWTHSRAIPILDEDGQIIEWFGVASDITASKRAEEEARTAQGLVLADLEAMTRLQKIGSLYLSEGSLEPILCEVVDAAIAISGSDFGTIQIQDPESGHLRIAAQRGFPQWWLDHWEVVSHAQGSCGTALASARRIIVEDVSQSPIFAGTPGLEMQLRAGIRSIQSTPLRGGSGKLVGMLSTHSRTPGQPDERVLRLLDLLARQAADIIEHKQAEDSLKGHATVLQAINVVLELGLGHQSEEEMCEACLDIVEKATGSTMSYIGETGSDGLFHDLAVSSSGWDVCSMYDQDGHRKRPGSFPIRGLYSRVLTEGKSLIANDPASHPDSVGLPLGHPKLRSFLGTPLFREGKTVGMIGVANSPTGYGARERRGLEAIAPAIVEALDRKRAEAGLRHANEQLQATDRAKDEFLAMLSHELRNPLAPIMSSLYILERAPAGSEPALRAGQVIGRQAEHLRCLVNDLLNVARITHKKFELHRTYLELNQLVRCATEDSRYLFERAGVDLQFLPAPRDVPVYADGTRLAQVVGNLLHNSAKFTGRGGHTTLAVTVDGNEAVLRVADDGVGMSSETLEHIFRPFAQAPRTLDRSQGGLGLGLALVKNLVELHGGGVSARSEGLGCGSEITVRLPIAAEGPPASVVPPSRPVGRAHPILIIEDNVDVADSLSEALMLGGHPVQVAYNGPEGVAMARESRPEIVLCDIGLPGMDGYEVARTLRQDESLRGMYLVALTGYVTPADMQRAAEAGFDRHLAKPTSIEKLEQLLAELPRTTTD